MDPLTAYRDDGVRERHEAILLLGPTGAGKTPVGECLEASGLGNRRCVHFDFGANLRRIASDAWHPPRLTREGVGVVLASLRRGTLLEDRHFHIAAAVLLGVLSERHAGRNDIVILNGLPRHAGQARDVDRIVDVRTVVSLECTPEVVVERIRLDTGGDRAARSDDSLPEIRRKLAIYAERTAPLLDHYLANGVRVLHVAVGVDTRPWDVTARIANELGPGMTRDPSEKDKGLP